MSEQPVGTEYTDCFIRFKADISKWPLPDRFTFPFYYDPHPLSRIAAGELQAYLASQATLKHEFHKIPGETGPVYGKMFGVLVVQTPQQEIGYLAAFSGKLASGNQQPGFVPPVFDFSQESGFYRQTEAALNTLNQQIEMLESNPKLKELLQLLAQEQAAAAEEITLEKVKVKAGKLLRQQHRNQQEKVLSPDDLQILEAKLSAESLREYYGLKDLKKYWKRRQQPIQDQINRFTDEIQALKEARKSQSAAVQLQIFSQFSFLNQAGVHKALIDIFPDKAPPAGAGECAAPKLLQYAFLHRLKPIAMAEFWWGEAPAGEVRRHGHFYPACRGKCEPILAHMLEGIALDDNPLLYEIKSDQDIDILFADTHLLVINKPAGLLSVPGIEVSDSVYSRVKERYPLAEGPLIVHRLDRATSGLMLIALTNQAYRHLQNQFLQRAVQKRYIALLEGVITKDSGVIDLPLRADPDDRPRQVVCYEYGKPARTLWEVVSLDKNQTRIHFYPVTGRTHQLRVHAAHPVGLNTAIVGDDIYGQKSDRLYLHAAAIEFIHPVSGELIKIMSDPEF